MNSVQVRIPHDKVLEAAAELAKIPCLRKQVDFSLDESDEWEVRYGCNGFGNGLGVGHVCTEHCSLRITDEAKTEEVYGEYDYTEVLPFKVQPEFWKRPPGE